MTKLIRITALPTVFLAASVPSVPALAQPDEASSVFDRDYLTVGVGVAVGPSYEGSDDYAVYPVPALQGKLGGIGITPRPGGIVLDLIDDASDARLSLQAGPAFRLRFDRNRQIKDAAVRALGKRDVAVELGANAGFSINRLASPYDSLTFSADVRWDVAKAHRGTVVSPAVTYMTPLSRGIFTMLTLSAEHVDDDYARYYFSVTPTDSAASGLPAYAARSGWKNVGAGLLTAFDIDGNLTNGGFSLFAGVGYSRLLGNFKRAPSVAVRGDADQFMGAVGIGYTF